MSKEVVVIFASEGAPNAVTGFSAVTLGPSLSGVLHAFGVSLEPVLANTGAPSFAAEHLSDAEKELARYFRTEVDDERAEALAAQLNELPQVACVYVKPQAENPIAPFHDVETETALSTPPPGAPAITPNFVGQQGYLGPAPGGVGTAAAWPQHGGDGAGVEIIDIEGGWCLTHVDLPQNIHCQAGVPFTARSWRDHGSAVLGEIVGLDNNLGVKGIAPGATINVVSHNGLGSAKAIQFAAASLEPGSIILLEMHRPGPRFNFTQRQDQRGYVAVEWWPDDLLAIRAAVQRGIIVIEAAGNGAEDLDDLLYDSPAPGFPASWSNPFRGAVDSGAIVVGAGAPPGNAFGPDRSRLDFSNYGSRVNCQGWGRGVVTTGYGDLHVGSGEDENFTQTFAGTSSASPIVTGVVACLQGIARNLGRPLQPLPTRALLAKHGSSQMPSPIAPLSQNIGPRPDLAVLVPLI